MKTQCRVSIFASVLLLSLLPTCGYSAYTARWQFTNPAQYEVSNSNEIEVADGVARLKQSEQSFFVASLEDYDTGVVSGKVLHAGADVGLGLEFEDPLYAQSGEFLSRVIDGGGAGNVWQSFFLRTGNEVIAKNNEAQTPTFLNGLRALYHLNQADGLLDVISGNSGTPVGALTYDSEAIFGPESLHLQGTSYAELADTTAILDGVMEFSVAMWIRMDNWDIYAPVMWSEGGTSFLGFKQSHHAYRTFTFSVDTAVFATRSVEGQRYVMEADQWYFVVVTWNGYGVGSGHSPATQALRMYIDGELSGENTHYFVSGALDHDTPLYFGGHPDLTSRSRCYIDEIAMFDYELNAEEIRKLYFQAASVKAQIRSSSAETNLVDMDFVGPDGTSDTAFSAGESRLPAGAHFNPAHQYAQYRLLIGNNPERDQSPLVSAVGFSGSHVDFFDDASGDFREGTVVNSIVTYPDRERAEYLGLSKLSNGGFVTSGSFISRPLDSGQDSGVTWNLIKPNHLGQSIDNTTKGLLGLWRFDGNFADSSTEGGSSLFYLNGADNDAVPPKLGRGSCLFNGVDGRMVLENVGTLKTVEFWVRADELSDGLIEIQETTSSVPAQVTIERGRIAVNNWPGPVLTYVNGALASPLLRAGWNHVALTCLAGAPAGFLTIGESDGDPSSAAVDDLAVYDRVLSVVEIAAHYANGMPQAAGKLTLSVRVADDIGTLLSLPFTGAYIDLDGDSLSLPGRYLQYRAVLEGDGNATPAIGSILAQYNFVNDVYDAKGDDFGQGTFVNDQTTWYGEDLMRGRVASAGPINTRTEGDSAWAGLWHLDEDDWPPGSQVLDSSGKTRHGSPSGGAETFEGARVGLACGKFDGVDGFVELSQVPEILDNDFTVGIWFSTESTTRAALISSYDADRHFTLEINGDGAGGEVPGQVAFIISDPLVGTNAVVAQRGSLNDGVWHHVAGVRHGNYIHVYVDGDREGSVHYGGGFLHGLAVPYLAKYGSALDIYYEGLLDEAAIVVHALTDGEIGQLAGVGTELAGETLFTSDVIDAGRVSIWEEMSWGADGPHGLQLTPSDGSLIALWNLDESSGGTVADATGNGHPGAVTGAGFGLSGAFSNALEFTGGSDQVSVSDPGDLSPTHISIEAWVLPSEVRDIAILDRHNSGAGTGYALFTDADGKPVFRLGSGECTAWLPLVENRWNHVAGTYDGFTLRLYINGDLRADQDLIGGNTSSGLSLLMGRSHGSVGGLIGRLDEVAIHDRALLSEELVDRYRSYSGKLWVQVRGWDEGDDPNLIDFVGPDGTPNTYFTEYRNADIEGVVGLRKFFQFRVEQDSQSARYPTVFRGLRAEAKSYSTINPWVAPGDGFGYTFEGRLLGFNGILGIAGANTEVRYQLSGDNGLSWYYWGGSDWQLASGLGWAGEVSEEGTIDDNIESFYEQLYEKDGGIFKFRAFLHSEGDYQIELDQVDIEASTGRIVVTEPNGDEVGDDAWVVGVTNIITWNAKGDVSGSLTIEFSEDGGQNWTTVDDNVPHSGTNGAYAWATPYFGLGGQRDECRIKITDNGDATVWDTSDADFELVFRYRLIEPNGGEVWYIGETNVVRWHEPPGLGTPADLYFNLNGHDQLGTGLSDPGWRYRESVPTVAGSTNNTYAWVTPKNIPELISPAARLQITPENSMSAHDMSDNSYTMAGIRITNPNDATAWKRGSQQTVTWAAAGDVAGGVTLEYSGNAGASWEPVVPETIPCSVSSNNTYSWTIVADNPSQNAMLRIVSTNQPRIWAVSDLFTVSDIDIKSPLAGDEWQTLTTYDIKWTAGGAGDEVNLFYSVDGGTNWILINEEDPVFNDNTTGVTNEYEWLVPDLPGDTQIRIQSLLSTELFADSDVFKISGIRITDPNSDARWEFGSQSSIGWVYAGSGMERGRVRFSYDNGNTFTNLKDVGLFSGNFGFTPDRPTSRALARVEALDEPYLSLGVAGQSDGYFTNAGIKVTSPVQTDVIKMGELYVNPIEWLSAGVLPANGVVALSYSDGITETALFSLQNNEDFNETTKISGFNFKPWTPEVSLNPSETARVKVFGSGPFGDYTAWSEQFVLQGVRFVEPTSGSSWNIDTTREIRWLNAGFGPGADARMYISADGGATFDPTPILPDVILDNGDVDWLIPFGTPPNTNAVLRLDVVDDPVSFSAYSEPFTLKGLSVSQPTIGTSWDLGASETIEVLAAGAGNLVNIYYSSDDGASFDTDNPIAVGASISDGPNSLPWTIELYREPSTNARVWVDSIATDATIVSDPFTVAGILVTDPSSVNIWAANETNRIEWIAVGTSGEFDVYLKDGAVETLIGDNITDTFLEYLTLPGDAGTDLHIVVKDTTLPYEGVSEPFKIVQDPTLEVLEPVDGQFLKNGRTYQVVWTKAGAMPLTFEASYSFDDFATTNVISGVPLFTNNQYFLDWELNDPSELGLAKVRVVNTTTPSIQDTTADIHMVADVTVNSPNGGGQYFALKTYDVAWFTLGDTTEFDIYYSTNQFRTVDSWKKINTGGPITGLGSGQLSQWSEWQVADDVSATVWLRIQDANYTDIYPANVEGPFDDSDDMFSITYYTIEWNVINRDSGVPLDKLAVSDSSGWSESGLSSPIIHYYPYGNYDTIWSRALFASKVTFDWNPEPSRTITVELEETGQEPDFDVMANFAYDSANNSFDIATWIERGGQVLGDPDASLIEVYESDGDNIEQISDSNPRKGVFFSRWDVDATEDELYGTNFNYASSEVFWAKVMVQFSGEWYSSALTFQLRQPASDEILTVIDAIEASSSNILGEVSGIGTLVGGVSNQVAGVSNQINALSGQVGDGFADVLASVGTNRQIMLDEVLPGIADVSNNLVNVFGPTITSTWDVVQLISGEVGGARILTRPLELIRGSTNTFLYRTQDYDPSVVNLKVYDATGTEPPLQQYSMQRYGSVAGIYRANVEIPVSFAHDTCVIECEDPDADDRLVVEIVDAAAGDLPGMMTQVYDAITNMESSITGLADMETQMTDLTGVLNGMTNDLQDLSDAVNNLPDLGVVTQAIDELAVRLDNLPDMGDLTNIIGNLETKIDNLPDLSVVTQEIAELSLKIDTLPDLSSLSNMVGQISDKIDGLPDLSSLSNSVQELQDAITLIPTNIDFTAVQDGIDNLRSDLAGVLNVDLTGVNGALSEIRSVVEGVGGTDMAGVESSLGAVEGRMTALESALEGVEGSFVSLEGSFDLGGVEASLAQLEDDVGGLESRLAGLETSLASAGTAAEGAQQYASSAKTKAGDAASGVQALKAALAAGDTEEAKRQLRRIQQALESAQSDIAKMPEGVTLDQLRGELGTTKQTVADLAKSNGFTWLTSMSEEEAGGQKTEVGEETDLGKLSANVEELRGSMEFMQKLLDKEVNKPVVKEQWLSVEE